MERRLFNWERLPVRNYSTLTTSKTLHVAGTLLYGVAFEVEEYEDAILTAPVFSCEDDRRETVLVRTTGYLCLVTLPENANKEEVDFRKLLAMSVSVGDEESLLDCFSNLRESFPSYGISLIKATVLGICNPGLVPLPVHEVENIEDLWAEADYFLTGTFPLRKETQVKPLPEEEKTPSGKVEESSADQHVTDEDLRLGLAKALAEEKLDALYGDVDYLLDSIARDILEGRMPTSIDLQSLTREQLIVCLTELANGSR